MRGYHRSKFGLVSILILLVALCSSATGQEHTVNYWLQVGNEFSSKGSYELAENCYDKAIEMDSRNVSAWSQKGLALAYLNKYNESLRAFEVAVKLDPKRVDVWISKGSALYILAKYNKTLENINETSEHLEPKNNYTFINNLNGSVEHKKIWDYAFNVSEGIRRIAAGLSTDNTDSELALLFEDPHGVASEDTAAIGTGNLGPIEVIDPEIGRWKVRVYGYDVPSGSTKFHINLINQSYLLSRYNESLKAYDMAIDIDSKSIAALNNKAVILYESHKINEAIELIDKSLKIEPLNAWTWLTKGQLFEDQKRYEEALQYFNNAIDLDPSYAEAWLDKSGTLRILGRIDEANAAIDKLAELTGDTIAYYPKS